MDSVCQPSETGRKQRCEAAISAEFDRRSLLVAGASLAAGCATMPWTPPPQQAFRTVEHQTIPMRDGVQLSARLWLPESGPAPAVLECIPYRKRDLYRPYDDIWGETLARAGIVFVRLDARGSGDSQGVMADEYSEAELDDCVETIAWIARQDWCTGAVGMRGLSWGGINTLQVAARRPPALKAIMPMGSCDRRYTDDAHYIGGGLGLTNFQWGVLFKKVMAGPPDPEIAGAGWREAWEARLKAAAPILGTWLTHQREDDYWKRGSVFETPETIDVPAYFVSGWSDTYSEPALRMFANHRAHGTPAKVLIGPWAHAYPYTAPQGVDWAHEEVRWWRHWLMGEATGIMDDPRVRLYMQDATAAEGSPVPGRWIAERVWPARTSTRVLFLNAGSLGPQGVRAADIVHRDGGVVGTTKPEWLERLPIEQSHDDAMCAVFDTAPLDEAMEIAGSAQLRLRTASDQPVAKLFVRLCEVKPDGQSWLVTWAALNLTRRYSMARPEPLEPGRIYDVTLNLRAIAHRFGAGSRIRLAISEGFWPMLWPSPVRPTLTFPTGVSSLRLPERAVEQDPAHFPMAETNGANGTPLYAPVSPNANGWVHLRVTTEPFSYPVEGVGTVLTSGGELTCEIAADDPLSCIWRQTTRSAWKRNDWDCAVEASYELTADANTFRIAEGIRAYEDGKQVFARSHETRIPRDLL
jgi:putative CocE/NonD family hydrolase